MRHISRTDRVNLDWFNDRTIKIKHVSTNPQLADILTKWDIYAGTHDTTTDRVQPDVTQQSQSKCAGCYPSSFLFLFCGVKAKH